MEIVYKCSCMQDDGKFTVDERDPGEDIVDFMMRVRRALTTDHRLRNPSCVADKVEYVKIPFDHDKGIGRMSIAPTDNDRESALEEYKSKLPKDKSPHE